MASTKAFRESYINSDPLTVEFGDFNSVEARLMRYQIYWAMFENTVYRPQHKWVKKYLTTYGLYKYIRSIYNPANRLGDWWQSHIWTGTLDPEAGDGKKTPSAIPIICDDENLRKAIAKIWEWSNWEIKKDEVTLHGSVLGDAVIKIVDDTDKQRVYMQPTHPGELVHVILDEWGNVKEYEINKQKKDPDSEREVLYREIATRDGDDVVYQTFKDNTPYDWNPKTDEFGKVVKIPEWNVPYGFVPMVVIQHRNMGLPWGWSEMHAGMAEFREVDDQASLLNDQIRKIVNAGWLFTGMSKPVNDPKPGRTTDEEAQQNGSPEGDRQNTPALYSTNANAKATALVAPLQIGEVLEGIEKQLKKIEHDYPELTDDIDNVNGDISGRALRLNREPIITKVEKRRPNYDNALVRAQMMCVSIAGWRGYDPVFSSFNLESYAVGKLKHKIDPNRPVYKKDPLDDLEVESKFWEAAGKAKNAGIPLLVFLERNGWTEEEIKKIADSEDYQLAMEQKRTSLEASKQLSENRIPNPGQKTGQKTGANNGRQST